VTASVNLLEQAGAVRTGGEGELRPDSDTTAESAAEQAAEAVRAPHLVRCPPHP
jgi:ATP-dependent DNA helicase RecQ